MTSKLICIAVVECDIGLQSALDVIADTLSQCVGDYKPPLRCRTALTPISLHPYLIALEQVVQGTIGVVL
ncbi:hypothetical protein NEOLEDRAFT_1139782 [Neolentinus lepideus HHB14362 ss-1]|uniref:Uncharacterized protein n=1 Tax=Neolentinus lepideus HHB14362 ss-1 TaxID=1314782 RepID=A0A165PKB0_9AGAM|nr:hypothetical protein NEOLEDRAFT_1139782 [Neolentinus lepideus HHB14362 ss-1]